MKKLILIPLLSIFLLLTVCGFGQNLIPNPSFEIYDTCPSFDGAVRYAIGWNINGINNTPDYYNSCSAYFSTPQNSAGYQIPFEGQAYCGFYTYWFPNPPYREYIGTQLATPLNIGVKYFVSFYISLSNYFCGTNKIGILFSTNQYYFDGLSPTYINMAQIFTQNIIIDTLNWVKISGFFIADSSYKYISIGNFFDNANTDTTILIGANCVAYYYLDNVCVSTDSLTCNPLDAIAEINSANEEFNVYPNPSVNLITIDIKENFKSSNVIFYDLLGKKYLEFTILPKANQININDFYPGIYFMQLNINNKIFYKKIIINK